VLPIRDNIPSRRVPFVNYAILAVCGAAFLLELSLGRYLEPFLLTYGLIPLKYAAPSRFQGLDAGDFLLPLLTHMFLHGGWMHLLANMWTLFIFGDNVEDALGHLRYLAYYLLCGLAAAVFQMAVAWASPAPMIGASGAIAGVMGGYFLLFPRARVLTLVPFFYTFEFVELPAVIFMGLWFFSQLYSGTVAVLAGAGRFGGVAWWAHIGGFMAGLFLVQAFVRSRRRRMY